MEHLLEVGEAGVRPAQDRDLLELDALLRKPTDLAHEPLVLRLRGHERRRRRIRSGRPRGSEHLFGSAEPWHEPVRELENLWRRAVVVFEPRDGGLREALAHAEQPGGRRAGEGVDRLVVVADHAEVFSIAEPQIEQRLLQQVHILVLVDREGPMAVSNVPPTALVGLEQSNGELEHILEVDLAAARLAALVFAIDTRHQVGRDRRLVLAERRPVRRGGDAEILRPLDLGCEVAGGSKAVRPRERVRDLAEEEGLRRQDPPDRLGRVAVQLCERGRVDVRASTPSTPRAVSRVRITPAALSVNVTARISSGRNVPVATCHAMRRVIVVVLPEPAPARTQTGPRTASAARLCSWFSPPRMSTEPPYRRPRPDSARDRPESVTRVQIRGKRRPRPPALCQTGAMCRNIRILYNFEPPTTPDEMRAAALQYVRKVSGMQKPSRANEAVFEQAVDAVAAETARLLAALVTSAPPRDRDAEAERRRARAVDRYGRVA